MTTAASTAPATREPPLYGAVAALSAIVFLLAVAGLLNLALTHAEPPRDLRKAAVIAHLATILVALPLGVSQLLLPKGTFRHRTVGYAWLALMATTAIVSFGIHTIVPGGFSPIHALSVLTLVLVPLIAWRARRHDVAGHSRTVIGLMIGGLVIAGLFTFVPGRVLGHLVAALFHHP